MENIYKYTTHTPLQGVWFSVDLIEIEAYLVYLTPSVRKEPYNNILDSGRS